ncbi:unnamed protein product, partial [Ectocarpus sp. 12 AP-2014]
PTDTQRPAGRSACDALLSVGVAQAAAMRSFLSQVGLKSSAGEEQREGPANDGPDADAADVMGSFASPKRLGHHGSISDACVLSYEPTNGLMAVASRGGLVKVFGGPGVELVLEEEGASVAGEDPPSHLLFATPGLLVGVTATGAVLVWDLAAGGRGGSIPSPPDPATGLDERITSVHAHGCGDGGGPASDAHEERYVFLGFESGRVRVAQVFPVCRESGYTVEPQNTSHGAPDELLQAPGKSLGAVTAIASFGDRDGGGGGFGIFGHRRGGIVVWDWVRRKRLAFRSLGISQGKKEEEEDGDYEEEDFEDREGREVTSLALHPSGEAFAAGFAAGCYAIFSVSSSPSHEIGPPRWVREVGDDGSCPREGPTIVRTAVSLVRWVRVRAAGADRTSGLVVAGGVEIEEGEEPDGVSLLVHSSEAVGARGGGGGGGRAVKKKDVVTAAKAALETAVFVPFAVGQERLSHVHCVLSGAGAPTREPHRAGTRSSGDLSEDARVGGKDEPESAAAQEDEVKVAEELVVLGLVKWNEEFLGDDGRLHFRLASSVQACPIQTSPYVALLQLAPERFGPHLSGFATVTAVACTPLLSSSTILDFMTCLGAEQAEEEGRNGSQTTAPPLLRGGYLRWPDSVPSRRRDEALGTSELLVAGHSDGSLSFWECCGPASRQDTVCLSEGRVVMREVPSGAVLLGSVPAAGLGSPEEGAGNVAVAALDVWVERDHVAAAAAAGRNACWVAVGLESGDTRVIVLSNRMEAGSSSPGFPSGSGAGSKARSGGGTPLAEKPVEVSDVKLGDDRTTEDASAKGGSGGGRLLKRFLKRGAGQQPSPEDEEGAMEDTELEAAIAEARAEARAIAALEESREGAPGNAETAEPRGTAVDDARKRESVGGEGKVQETDDQEESDHLRQELSEAMVDEGAWSGSVVPPLPKRPHTKHTPEADKGEEEKLRLDEPPKASLIQLALRLHSHAVRCVALSFDARGSALSLVVADEAGVVSVTDVSTGSASLLPMRVPQSRPCRPSVTIGPMPSALSGGQAPEPGTSGALFVLLEGWLNVFDLASRDPVDFVQVPGLAPPRDNSHNSGGGGGRAGIREDDFTGSVGRTRSRERSEETPWLACVDKRGLPLVPYASEPFSSSFSPPPRKDDAGTEADGGKIDPEDAPVHSHTIWVSPVPSRTALDDYHEHELQVLSDTPPPEPLLVVVRGATAVVLAISRRDADGVTSSVFARRGSVSPDTATFKGRSGAELVVRSRGTLPPAGRSAVPPTIDGAGVCMVAAAGGGGLEMATMPDSEEARRRWRRSPCAISSGSSPSKGWQG